MRQLAARATRTTVVAAAFADCGQLIGEQEHLAFHFDDELDHATAEVTMEYVRGNRDAQTRRRAYQRFADAAGHLHRIADAADHHREEHLDQAEHRAEQTEQRTDQRDRAERVEEPLQSIHDVPAGILDAFLDDLARPIAHGQRRREQLAERRVRTQYAKMLRIDLARARPFAHLVAEARRNHGRAPQRPEPFQNDRQRNRRADQDGHHRPAARHQDFEHGSTFRSFKAASRPPARIIAAWRAGTLRRAAHRSILSAELAPAAAMLVPTRRHRPYAGSVSRTALEITAARCVRANSGGARARLVRTARPTQEIRR